MRCALHRDSAWLQSLGKKTLKTTFQPISVLCLSFCSIHKILDSKSQTCSIQIYSKKSHIIMMTKPGTEILSVLCPLSCPVHLFLKTQYYEHYYYGSYACIFSSIFFEMFHSTNRNTSGCWKLRSQRQAIISRYFFSSLYSYIIFSLK